MRKNRYHVWPDHVRLSGQPDRQYARFDSCTDHLVCDWIGDAAENARKKNRMRQWSYLKNISAVYPYQAAKPDFNASVYMAGHSIKLKQA